MPAQQRLRIGSQSRLGRFEVGDRLPPSHDCEVLAPMFDSIQEVGEVAGRLGRADVRHKIRLSDPTASHLDGPGRGPSQTFRTGEHIRSDR